jgi:hypothetical protein
MKENSEMARSGRGGSGQRIAPGLMDDGPEHRMVPVWFFVGLILFVYGVLILASGIDEIAHPPATVLANLHPAVWWGALLIVIGATYVYLFAPRKT